MPPKRLKPDDPNEWLNRARSNLARARVRLADTYLEDLCFDAQQAAEKAIKAVLLYYNVPFPYVHDLGRLLTLLEEAGIPVPENVRSAEELTPYAVITRYPGLTEPIEEKQYQQALESAEAVLFWGEGIINSPRGL